MKTITADHDALYPIQQAYNEPTRMLMVHSTPLNATQMTQACEIIGNYNQFNGKEVAKILNEHFNDEKYYEFIVGREYSPVIHIIPKRGFFALEILNTLATALKADEVDIVDGRLRLWWD